MFRSFSKHQDIFWYVLSGEIGGFALEILFIQGILDIERRKAILISFLLWLYLLPLVLSI